MSAAKASVQQAGLLSPKSARTYDRSSASDVLTCHSTADTTGSAFLKSPKERPPFPIAARYLLQNEGVSYVKLGGAKSTGSLDFSQQGSGFFYADGPAIGGGGNSGSGVCFQHQSQQQREQQQKQKEHYERLSRDALELHQTWAAYNPIRDDPPAPAAYDDDCGDDDDYYDDDEDEHDRGMGELAAMMGNLKAPPPKSMTSTSSVMNTPQPQKTNQFPTVQGRASDKMASDVSSIDEAVAAAAQRGLLMLLPPARNRDINSWVKSLNPSGEPPATMQTPKPAVQNVSFVSSSFGEYPGHMKQEPLPPAFPTVTQTPVRPRAMTTAVVNGRDKAAVVSPALVTAVGIIGDDGEDFNDFLESLRQGEAPLDVTGTSFGCSFCQQRGRNPVRIPPRLQALFDDLQIKRMDDGVDRQPWLRVRRHRTASPRLRRESWQIPTQGPATGTTTGDLTSDHNATMNNVVRPRLTAAALHRVRALSSGRPLTPLPIPGIAVELMS